MALYISIIQVTQPSESQWSPAEPEWWKEVEELPIRITRMKARTQKGHGEDRENSIQMVSAASQNQFMSISLEHQQWKT